LSLADAAETFFTDVIGDRVTVHLDPLTWSVKKLDPLYKPDADEIGRQGLVALGSRRLCRRQAGRESRESLNGRIAYMVRGTERERLGIDAVGHGPGSRGR
jgi:hypothetical protein